MFLFFFLLRRLIFVSASHLILNGLWTKPVLVVLHIGHAEVAPRHEVEIREELEQEARDAVTPSNEAFPAPSDRRIHWLANEGNLYKNNEDENND